MKRILSLGCAVFSLVLLFEQACFAEEIAKNMSVSSTKQELNDAQILEKKMLENKKQRKTRTVRSSVRRQQGAKTETNVQSSDSSSAKGLPHSKGLPSLSGNMYIK